METRRHTVLLQKDKSFRDLVSAIAGFAMVFMEAQPKRALEVTFLILILLAVHIFSLSSILGDYKYKLTEYFIIEVEK